LLVEQPGDAADLRLGDPQPKRLDELIDAPGQDAAHVGLLHHRHERLLRALARLQKRWEVAALADLRDLQLDLPGPGIPAPRAVAVAMRRAILGALAALRANQLTDLGFHQLLRHSPDRLANDVCVLIAQHLTNDLSDRHPVRSGHRRPPIRRP
jgi:hypothetical protein